MLKHKRKISCLYRPEKKTKTKNTQNYTPTQKPRRADFKNLKKFPGNHVSFPNPSIAPPHYIDVEATAKTPVCGSFDEALYFGSPFPTTLKRRAQGSALFIAVTGRRQLSVGWIFEGIGIADL
jgi:hypothetical protein